MKTIRVWSLIAVAAVVFVGTAAIRIVLVEARTAAIGKADRVAERPVIRPDFSDTVIPPNIAPLNFRIVTEGDACFVRISSKRGGAIDVFSRDGDVVIPEKRWHKLLEANRGQELLFEIYIRLSGVWKRCETVNNVIAKENIDGYLAYRRIGPVHNFWHDVAICQRDLAGYDQSLIFSGRSCANACVNCHTPLNNDPSHMFLGIRSSEYGSATLLADGGQVHNIDAKWGYTSWHPTGRVAAYSINKVVQFFHSAGSEVRDVADLDSFIAYYDLSSRKAKTCEGLADKGRLETYPTWSPDGRHLYFCSAAIPWSDRDSVPPEGYASLKYDLRRISYDVETDTWGEPETVLSSEQTGKSILLPRFTPDGRMLVFCMCDYGCFPIYQHSSDIYVMDPLTRSYREAPVNSEYSESWHSFSSNSRWMAFSSRRQGGLFTRTYISYIDTDGVFHKPFVLPQKDPTFYDSSVKTYSVPELIVSAVKVKPETLAKAVRAKDKIEAGLPVTGPTPKATVETEPWQKR